MSKPTYYIFNKVSIQDLEANGQPVNTGATSNQMDPIAAALVFGGGGGDIPSYFEDITVKGIYITSNSTVTPINGGLGGLIIESTSTDANAISGTISYMADAGGVVRHTGAIAFGRDGVWSPGNYPGYVSFWTRQANSGDEFERLRIAANGNIGIGTATPDSTVKIEQNIDADISVTIKQSNTGSTGNGQSSFGAVNSRDDLIGVGVRPPNWGDGFSFVYSTGKYLALASGAGNGSFTGNTTDPLVGSIRFENSSNSSNYITSGIILANGNFGVGTTSPISKFQVVPNSSSGSSFFIDSYDTGGGNINVLSSIRSYGNNGFADGYGAEYARGSISSPAIVQVGDELGYFYFSGWDGSGFRSYTWITGKIDGTPGASNIPTALVFNTGATGSAERMRITSAGNVGIGTSVPTQKFQVNSVTASDSNFAVGGFSVTGGSTSYGENISYNSAGFGDGFYGTYARGTAASPAAVQSGDEVGYFGFGGHDGTEFRYRSYIVSPVDGTVSSGTVPMAMAFYTGAGAATERMRITSSGVVIIGDTTPFASNVAFQVSKSSGSDSFANFYNGSTGSALGGVFVSLQPGGNNTDSYHFAGVTETVAIWYLYGNGTTSYSSDVRLKKNIETTRDGYLDDIARLRVVKYNWYTDSDETPRELGLIAQEVEQVFPGLVQDAMHATKDGQIHKVLKASVLTPILIKALQEANEKITALEDRLTVLENR